MSDEAKKSHWQSLAEQLGAEQADEPDHDRQQPGGDEIEDGATDDMAPDGNMSDSPPAFAPVEPKAQMPEKTAADWNSLAISLGIDPADLPPPASKPAAPKSAVRLEAEPEEVSADVEIDDASDRDELAEDESDLDFDDSPREKAEPFGASSQQTDDREVTAEESEQIGKVGELDDVEAKFGGLDADGDQPDRTDEEEEAVPRRRRRRRRRRRGQSFDEASEAEEENYSAPVESIESAVEFDSPPDDERGAAIAIDEQVPGAEPATPSESPVESSEEEAEQGDRSEPEAEPRRRRRRRRGRRGSRRDPAAAEEPPKQDAEEDRSESEDEQQGESPDHEGSQRTVVHRNIPTWDEAMEIIIAKNTERRSSDTRSSAGAGRRSGRGGRGGRGRGANKRS